PCASLQYSAMSFGPAAGSGTVTVSAPAGGAWTASTPAGWIPLTGPGSGTGNGTVAFTVASNPLPGQRTGYLALGRQSTPITQFASGAEVLSVSPRSGAQSSAMFTFQF